MLSPELEKTLQSAVNDVRERQHEYLQLEHLLLALLDDDSTGAILKHCGCDLGQLRTELEEFLTDIEVLPEDVDVIPEQTLAFQRVLQRALMHAQGAERDLVSPGNILIAMFRERESHAVYLLEKQGVSRFDVINYVSHGISKVDPTARSVSADGVKVGAEEEVQGDPLENFCTDLNARAEAGKIDPLIGREDELERCVQVLCRVWVHDGSTQ